MTDRPDNLAVLFDDLAEQLGEVDASAGAGVTEYLRAGRPFAAVEDATTAELRLNVEVAEAARRTPGTHASTRGADWVRFRPTVLDQHTLDRAEAWFMSAWRAARDSRR